MDWGNCVVDGIASFGCIPALFHNVINGFLVFAGITAVIIIIYSGIIMVTSGGDPKKVEKARQSLTYAIVGLTIVLLSFAIILSIGYLTGATECITSFNDVDKLFTGCGAEFPEQLTN